jgi:hypothetical protein
MVCPADSALATLGLGQTPHALPSFEIPSGPNRFMDWRCVAPSSPTKVLMIFRRLFKVVALSEKRRGKI